jgi:hypothetical protein
MSSHHIRGKSSFRHISGSLQGCEHGRGAAQLSNTHILWLGCLAVAPRRNSAVVMQ